MSRNFARWILCCRFSVIVIEQRMELEVRPAINYHLMAAQMRGGSTVDDGSRQEDRRSMIQMSPRQHRLVAQGDDHDEDLPSRHLWVGNVSHEAAEGLLMEKFSKFGPIETITVYSHRKYAFINFRKLDDAHDAKNGLQGVALGGFAMRIEYAKGAKPSRHLWVGGISKTVSREQIEGEFKSFGIMEDFKFLRDRDCAFVDFAKIEDAIAAVNSLNRKVIGEEELRVDFGRSQPPKRLHDSSGQRRISTSNREKDPCSRMKWDCPDQSRVLARMHNHTDIGNQTSDREASVDNYCGPADRSQGDYGACATGLTAGKSRDKEEPSDVLWIRFPLLSEIDEEDLHRAFVPHGEVKRVKTFPGRTYAFVQFKNIEEAQRAKDSLEGKLFNDPRVHIRFSNSDIGPFDNPRTDASQVSPIVGKKTSEFSEMFVGRTVSNNPVHSVGLRPEYYPGGLSNSKGLATGVGICLGHMARRVPMQSAADGRVITDGKYFHSSTQSADDLSGLYAGSVGMLLFDQIGNSPDEIWREPKRPRTALCCVPGSADSNCGGSQFTTSKNLGSWQNFGVAESPIPNETPPEVANCFSRKGSDRGHEVIKAPGLQGVWSGSIKGEGFGLSVSGHMHARKRAVPGPCLTHGYVEIGHTKICRDGDLTGVKENWLWHGTIAKGGTPVCRAQCLPLGKYIEVAVPDVVNCTARTDLNMLAKHLYQAGDFGVVFFVPEADPDGPPYYDFMQYLGEKHRAGVAKLTNGINLFLVPPSDFSEKVLKVPGNNCIFGVLLKCKQRNPLESTQLQPPLAPVSQLHHVQHQQSLSSQQQPNPSNLQLKSAYSGLFPPVPLISSSAQAQLCSKAGGLPGVLTPDLIVSLSASRLQRNLTPDISAAAQPTRVEIVNDHLIDRGAPVASRFASLSSTENESLYWPLQNTSQSVTVTQGWLSSHPEQSLSSGERPLITSRVSVLSPQPPHTTRASNMLQSTTIVPPSKVQEGYTEGHKPQRSVHGRQQMPLQARPRHPPPQSTPRLPPDQLVQLTTCLTQRQELPSHQQKTAKLLQQHCRLEPQFHTLSGFQQMSHLLPHHHAQRHNQEPDQQQCTPHRPTQHFWSPIGTIIEQSSLSIANNVDLIVGSNEWIGRMEVEGHQHQLELLPPRSQDHVTDAQQQFLHPLPLGSVIAEQAAVSSTHVDADDQKRFHATLQLAAALLQHTQHQHLPHGHPDHA